MGRHRTAEEKAALGREARRLREEGLSLRRICLALGIGEELLGELLSGRPRREQVVQRQRKAAEREAAVALRRAGATYDAIVRELGVSKSSCSVWLRDVPVDPGAAVEAVQDDGLGARDLARARRRDGALLKEIADELGLSVAAISRWCSDLPAPDRARHGRPADQIRAESRRYWDLRNAERDRLRDEVHAQAALAVGEVTGRDLVLALAISYWCEGAKAKPWNPQERIRWMNSDPGLVTLLLAGLRQLDVPAERVRFRLSLHEDADEPAARAWWAAHVGVPPQSFQPTTLKRHRPTTTRKNVGETYRGCLTVAVLDSRELYQRLDGLVRAMVGGGDWHSEEQGSPSALV